MLARESNSVWIWHESKAQQLIWYFKARSCDCCTADSSTADLVYIVICKSKYTFRTYNYCLILLYYRST